MAQNRHWEQDKEATVYVGNIDERVTPAVLYEIMLQMGPIHNLYMPRDRVTQNHQGFGFVEFRSPVDADYVPSVMNGIKLYGKSLRINKASADKQRQNEVGAELFIGNLDPMIDEKILYDTFSRFGPLLAPPKIARDDHGASKGYGFVSYAKFAASDDAIATMNGQLLVNPNKEISVQYAYKRDGKGERHGDEAERTLAAEAERHNIVPEAQPIPAAFLNGAPAPPPAGFDPAMGPPASPALGHGGFGARAAFSHHPSRPNPYAQQQQQQPHAQTHVHAHAHGPNGLPIMPSPAMGLPARPPQSQGAYTNPADFHPGSFRPPSSTPPQGFPMAAPPPGFGGAPPGAPPVGFMPPPGTAAPPGFHR